MKEKKFSEKQRIRQMPNAATLPSRDVSWSALEQQVARMQKQIAQACLRGDKEAMHTLQQRLLETEAARLLAVRRVAAENQGKDTAGVDGVKSLTSQERLTMAAAIHPNNWKYQPSWPVRRVWVPKLGTTERRPLAILPMIDRCKQALVKLALEPEWETKFEPHSYGFRPGRSAHDAIAAILVAIERRPLFVFDADIEGAFDSVNQAVILEKLQTFPALRQAITGWLRASVLDGDISFPGETGIPQGGALSPLLLNVALHGMEAVAADGATRGYGRELPLLIRYADDFLILHPDLKELQQAARRVMRWLATMGLQLNTSKTRITHTLTPYQGQVGFDFLGFALRQEPIEKAPAGKRRQELTAASRTLVTPSQEASKRHLMTLEQRLQRLQSAPQGHVIADLNPLIAGWAAYYNGVVAAATMRRYDELLEQRLLIWASKRHPGKPRDWLLTRYWQQIGKQGRVFATPDGVQLRRYQQTILLRG